MIYFDQFTEKNRKVKQKLKLKKLKLIDLLIAI